MLVLVNKYRLDQFVNPVTKVTVRTLKEATVKKLITQAQAKNELSLGFYDRVISDHVANRMGTVFPRPKKCKTFNEDDTIILVSYEGPSRPSMDAPLPEGAYIKYQKVQV